MNTNQLSNEARKVLMAIFQDGAKEGQIHSLHIENIMRLLGWKASQESNEKIRAILHDLLTSGYSMKVGDTSITGSYLSNYEIDQNGNLKITVNIPEKLAYHL